MPYEYVINKLCEEFTKEQLAEQLLTYKELTAMYKKDNEELRKDNDSLMYLIAKYSIYEEGKHENSRSKSKH